MWQFQLDVTFVLSLHFSLGKHLAREEQNVRGIVLHVNSNICRFVDPRKWLFKGAFRAWNQYSNIYHFSWNSNLVPNTGADITTLYVRNILNYDILMICGRKCKLYGWGWDWSFTEYSTDNDFVTLVHYNISPFTTNGEFSIGLIVVYRMRTHFTVKLISSKVNRTHLTSHCLHFTFISRIYAEHEWYKKILSVPLVLVAFCIENADDLTKIIHSLPFPYLSNMARCHIH